MQLVEDIISFLAEPELKRLKAINDQIVEANREVTKNPALAVMHQGFLFRHSEAPKGKHTWPALDHSLTREANGYMENAKNVARELQIIKQGLLTLLKDLLLIQDIRDALPECLVRALPHAFNNLPRTREEAWNLDRESRAYRNYEKMIPKIEFFTAARMIY